MAYQTMENLKQLFSYQLNQFSGNKSGTKSFYVSHNWKAFVD